MPHFAGQRGPEILRGLLEIESVFEKNLNLLKDVKKTILDVKATSWHDDYNRSDMVICPVVLSSDLFFTALLRQKQVFYVELKNVLRITNIRLILMQIMIATCVFFEIGLDIVKKDRFH